jgi:hypothetical protein
VNGSTCNAAFNAVYPNKPCVSVTVCDSAGDPGSCQVIDDILLDTGDSGLRIFRSVLNATLQSQLDASTTYDCVEYGDGSTVWGPVGTARVTLGGENYVTVPIHEIGSNTSDRDGGGNHVCANQLTSVNAAAYNGSLGLGIFQQDCGLSCAPPGNANNGEYFTYNGVSVSGTAVVTGSQVTNPVTALLPLVGGDNNGIIVQLPSVPSGGAASANGYVVLGIGTEANNAASGVTAYGASPAGHFASFTTTFNGVSYVGFLDTGSNGIFVSFTGQPGGSPFYAPSCTLSLSATNTGVVAPLANAGAVPFQIANADTLAATGNNVFFNLAGPLGFDEFDWGIPFFLGRNVYLGIDQKSSSLGTGPYWAY